MKRKEDLFFAYKTMKLLRQIGGYSLDLRDKICNIFKLCPHMIKEHPRGSVHNYTTANKFWLRQLQCS